MSPHGRQSNEISLMLNFCSPQRIKENGTMDPTFSTTPLPFSKFGSGTVLSDMNPNLLHSVPGIVNSTIKAGRVLMPSNAYSTPSNDCDVIPFENDLMAADILASLLDPSPTKLSGKENGEGAAQENHSPRHRRVGAKKPSGPASFLGVRLWRMVNELASTKPHLVRWTDDGNGFLLNSEKKFAKELLESMEKHSFRATSFRSLHRMLNHFGLHVKSYE
jgi:hypothetical protein